MTKCKGEQSILATLALIQRAPTMYLGGGSRSDQLHALQAIMTGYSLALRQHGVGNDDLRVIGQLEDFLRKRSGADNVTGIDHVLFTSPTDAVAWNRVWTLIDEFRAAHPSSSRS